MANNYEKNIEDFGVYKDILDEILFAYDSLYLNGYVKEDDINMDSSNYYYLIEKPAVFFRPPLPETSKTYLINLKKFNCVRNQLLKAFPDEDLKKLFDNSYEIFAEAIKYGLEFTTKVPYITNFVNSQTNTKTIFEELKNIACATVECASYFHSATSNVGYIQSRALEALDNVQSLFSARMNFADCSQSYAHFNQHVINGTEFVKHYNNIKNADLTASELLTFTKEFEIKRLDNELIFDGEDEKTLSPKLIN